MKRLILSLIIILLISATCSAQYYPYKKGVDATQSYTWTVPQYFTTLIADLIITNRVDSTTSIRLYDTSGTLYALFSADTSYIPNLTVGNLNSTTIINGSSVTTNSLISDTLISNSPLHLRTDSLFFGVLNDTSKVLYNELLYSGNKRRGVIYPNVDYGLNIGTWKNRVDSVKANKVKSLKVETDSLYLSADLVYGSKIWENSVLNLYGRNGWYLGYRNTVSPATQLSWTTTNPNNIYLSNGIHLVPNNTLTSDLGLTTSYYRSAFVRTINVDSVRTGHSIFMSTVTEPATPTTGQIYFNGTNWVGWNGTAWKQFDN